MPRISIRIPDDLARALETASIRLERRKPEVIRMALRAFLAAPAGRARPADRVRPLLGSLDSGIADLAENHRA
jgi:metal-responsive CopG/Arc/MetJ family transcriptional regulator